MENYFAYQVKEKIMESFNVEGKKNMESACYLYFWNKYQHISKMLISQELKESAYTPLSCWICLI